MPCWDGFGNLLDGAHPVWIGDFTGDGRTDVLFHYGGDANWWLASFDGNQLQWRLVGNTRGFGNLLDGAHPIWITDLNGDRRAEILFYHNMDGNWWLATFDGTQLRWALVDNTGRAYRSRLRLHVKILTNPAIAVGTMIAQMRTVYGSANIRLDHVTTENLTARTDLAPLRDCDVGECVRRPWPFSSTTAEQDQLFNLRNNVGRDDVVVYFVRSTVPALNGCATHPAGRPGAVVTRNASQWTLGHEDASMPVKSRSQRKSRGSAEARP